MGGITAPNVNQLHIRAAAPGSSVGPAASVGAVTQYYNPVVGSVAEATTGVGHVFVAPPGGSLRIKSFTVLVDANTLDSASTLEWYGYNVPKAYATITIPAGATGMISGVINDPLFTIVSLAIVIRAVFGGTALQSILIQSFIVEYEVS